jgi:alkaline phosphatase
VRVAAKAYRNVVLTEPGEYTATLRYYNGSTTVANWLVRDVPAKRRAKNLILFIGDGMTTNMITGKHRIYLTRITSLPDMQLHDSLHTKALTGSTRVPWPWTSFLSLDCR